MPTEPAWSALQLALLAALRETEVGKPVSLQVESNLSQEQYDIVLM